MICQCKEEHTHIFALRFFLPSPHSLPCYSAPFSSLPYAGSLYENMQYNFILFPRSTLAFEQGSYVAFYFGKNHFMKTALQQSEAKMNLFSLTSHGHSVTSVYPTYGLKYSKPMIHGFFLFCFVFLVFGFLPSLFCFRQHHNFSLLPSLA